MIYQNKLTDIIAPSFYPIHHNIKNYDYSQYVLKGGRGSTKSSFVSVEVILIMRNNPNIHAVVLRKVGNTLQNSVLEQYQWALDVMGFIENVDYKVTNKPMRITFLDKEHNGQRIMFFGADDKGKLKSLKIKRGYIGILHFEELDQFAGEEEVRNIEQSVLRGGDITYEFKTFNPPQTIMNWANKYCLLDKPNQLIFHSDYTTVPKEWLGKRFLDDAEYLKAVNPTAYEHEYLGQANGTGGNVFSNVSALDMSELKKSFDRIYNGLDWGYYPDPFAFNRCHFDANRRDLYIWDELTLYKTGNRQSADALIDKKGITPNDLITCDSAEPKSIGDYRSYGLMARGAQKGPNSVEYSMKWLASLNHIYIDAKACPDTWQEFTEYEYARDKDNNIISGYIDANNHHIDAVRYSCEHIWKRRGQ